MKDYCCNKCGSIDIFIDNRGTQKALMCGDCGAWLKWIGKKELPIVERYILDRDSKKTIPEKSIKVGINMKVSEFLKVAKDTELFYINKVGSPISVNNDYSDRNDLEFGEFASSIIEEVTFILEMEKSCQYVLNIIPVIFIK